MRCRIRNVFLFARPELLETITCPSQNSDTPQRLTFLLSPLFNKSAFVIPCRSPLPILIHNRSTSHHARPVHSRSSCVILCSSRSLSHTQDQYATAFEVISVGPEPTMLSPAPSPFPLFFENTDTPFSSSSSSLFKPDPTPNCTLLTTRSQKRRRPSCSTDLKRLPKKGDHNYVKRPENAFILSRSKCHEYRRNVQGEHDTVMSSQTRMLHHSNGPFSLNLLPAYRDFCQGSGFEASLQVSHSSYLSSPSMLIEISRPMNPLPTCITPEMSPRTGPLPAFRLLIRCLTNLCFKKNQCSPRNHRQYRDSHYHFPQSTSSGPPTLCSVCRILSAARTSGTPLRSKHK